MLATQQWILKTTKLGEPYVWLLLIVIILMSIIILRLRPSPLRFRQGFFVTAFCGYAVLVVLWLVNFPFYWLLLREDHVVEWLTAHFLIVASILCLILGIRLACKGVVSPVVWFFSAGFFTAYCREMEWGQPFWGRKVWYSRHMFQPHIWFDRSYFESFLLDNRIDAITVTEAIWFNFAISTVTFILGAAASLYFIKHRKQLIEQILKLPNSTFGRWFLVGLSVYIGAQFIDELRNLLPGSDEYSSDMPRLFNYYYMRKLDEPLECLGSIAFWFSTMILWMKYSEKSTST